MQPKFCLPIIKSNRDEVTKTINDNLGSYDYFEVWLDYLETVDEAFVSQLVRLLDDRLMLLFRRQKLETIKMPLKQRLMILDHLDGAKSLVDLDITTQQPELDYISQSGLKLKLLISYHNYKETPNTMRLKSIVDTMKAHQPTVYKLATMCENPGDDLRLLQYLLELKAKNMTAVVVGMGEYGQATRIFGALWGNEMTFAPINSAGQTAPGQLTRSQLEAIFKELER